MKSKKPKEKPELFVPAKPENPDTPRIYKEGQPPSFFYRDNVFGLGEVWASKYVS